MNITESPSCGKTLTAARSYSRGDCILSEQPLVAVPAAGQDALHQLADAVLAEPGMAERLCSEFGSRVARIQLETGQLPARRAYLAAAMRRHPGQPIPLLLHVLAALNLQVSRWVRGQPGWLAGHC